MLCLKLYVKEEQISQNVYMMLNTVLHKPQCLQFIPFIGILQPVLVDSHRVNVPVLVEGDGLLQGDQCLSVVVRSGLRHQQ